MGRTARVVAAGHEHATEYIIVPDLDSLSDDDVLELPEVPCVSVYRHEPRHAHARAARLAYAHALAAGYTPRYDDSAYKYLA